MTHRILITGSRDWDDNLLADTSIADELFGYVYRMHIEEPVLVSGACPNGADRLAELAFASQGWPIERYPADWNALGKRAGFVRNAEMVESLPDVCFAFIRDQSKGASHTRALALKAGITTHTYRNEEGNK